MTLRRGFHINRGERCLVVEDVITTGKSTREIVELVEKYEGIVAGIGSLANRKSSLLSLPMQPRSLLSLDVKDWDPDSCPLCDKKIPLTSPGSRFSK